MYCVKCEQPGCEAGEPASHQLRNLQNYSGSVRFRTDCTVSTACLTVQTVVNATFTCSTAEKASLNTVVSTIGESLVVRNLLYKKLSSTD